MESSIAEFLMRQLASERLPTYHSCLVLDAAIALVDAALASAIANAFGFWCVTLAVLSESSPTAIPCRMHRISFDLRS